MEGFILGLTVKKGVSKVVSCSVSLILTLNWGTDILFEKLTPEIAKFTISGETVNFAKFLRTLFLQNTSG